MIRATRAVNAPDEYMTLTDDEGTDTETKTDKSSHKEKELARVGIASNTYNKNRNPRLKVYKSEKQEGE